MRTELIHACPHCGSASDHADRARSGADIVKCRECSLVYLRTRPIEEDLRVLYQKYADDESHMRLPKTDEERKASGLRRPDFVDFITEGGLRKGGKVMDVGCGWGALLDEMKGRNLGFQCEGFEICRKAADYCGKHIAACGHDRQFYDWDFHKGSYDYVTMCHVLEHMTDLNKAMRTIREMLRVGGMFAGIVPNFASRGSYFYKENWYWLDANFHYLHFTDHTLRKVLKAHGFYRIATLTKRGDFDAYRLKDAYQAYANQDLSDDMLNQMIMEEGLQGRGEELWFSAIKES